jgi:hypothetical protein
MLVSKYYYAMRKAILLLIPLLIWGCEKTYDNLIDTSVQNYQVSMTNPSEIVIFNSSDSLIVVQIIFTPQSEISSVDFDIISPDGSKLNTSSISLYDNGNLENGDTLANDKNYANKFPMSEYYLNGNYKIEYYVLQSNTSRRQVAIGTFNYFNGQDNMPPVISNTVVDPDTVVVTQPTAIFTSVEATDLNGPADILEVYFKVIRPDGTTNNNKVQLFDDGNMSNGDEVAGDGIYSRLVQVDQSNQKGTYRFEFQAKDRSDAPSNIINHYVLIQ